MYKLTATIAPEGRSYSTTLCRDIEYNEVRFMPLGVDYPHEALLFNTEDEAWRSAESVQSIARIHSAFSMDPIIVRTEEAET